MAKALSVGRQIHPGEASLSLSDKTSKLQDTRSSRNNQCVHGIHYILAFQVGHERERELKCTRVSSQQAAQP